MSFGSRMKAPDTLRARLTFWYVSVLTLALAIFAALLYAWLSRTLYRHHDHELLADADRIAHVLVRTPLDQESIERELNRTEGGSELLLIRDHQGELMYRSPLLQVAEPTIGHHEALVHAAAHAPRDPEFFTVTLEHSGQVRFICAPIDREPPAYVQIGNPLGDVPATLHAVALASVVLVPVVVLLASFGGWVIAGRALAPIESINATLHAIEATDLSRRVEVHPSDRELSGLVGTINGLLARLDRAFRDLREFSANASHQLQTPLAVMKGTIEFGRRGLAAQEGAAVFEELEQEVNDMSAVVADLQTLSLADADAAATGMTNVDFSAVCGESAEIIEALGEPREIDVKIEISRDVHVFGDAVKLKQVVLNLGDNAVKYTTSGGRVVIRLDRNAGEALLRVTDTGAGIAADQLPRIFDRFYRAPSKSDVTRGTGLGLAIVKRIIEVHRGSIEVSSTPSQGTTFVVKLPGLKSVPS